MSSHKPNGLAFKVTYNDGLANGGLVGYRGVCSDRIIHNNVRVEPKVWCSSPHNECRQYCDNDQNGPRPKANSKTSPCYESRLLARRPFKFWTGHYHSGPRLGEPIPINVDRVAVGDVVLLTTRTPERSEKDRIVFACYRVGKVDEDETGIYVESDGSMEILLPDQIAMNCRYWDYQRLNKNGSIAWGSGLFRYLDSNATTRFLNGLKFELGDSDDRDKIVRSFGDYVEFNAQNRFGSGRGGAGEGVDHRRLKEFVAENPESVNLPSNSTASVEYPFLSGDRVDVKFELPNGDAAVVEIETIDPLPGAHQALKYRTLLQAERLEELASMRVKAILVAHRFNDKTRLLAKKYAIELIEMKV